MSRRMMKASSGASGLVVWGWFAVVAISDGKLNGGDLPGGDAAKAVKTALAQRAGTGAAAFWCAWWSEDPRGSPETLPDDFGVVVGPLAHAEAVGEADRMIRRARGRPCYAVSIGEDFAKRCYREGARKKVSAVAKSREVALSVLKSFGVDPEIATVAAVRKAFRKMVSTKKLHPDHGGDPVEFSKLEEERKIAEEIAKLLELDRQAGAFARGERAPAPKKRKPKKPAEKKVEEVEHG